MERKFVQILIIAAYLGSMTAILQHHSKFMLDSVIFITLMFGVGYVQV